MRVLGLMSGTSADGVDAVLAHFEGPPTQPRWRLLRSASLAYPAELHRRIVSAGQGHPHSAAALLDLAEDITEHQASAARACDPDGEAAVVGCHGQTLWHRPPQAGKGDAAKRGTSWQMLQAPLLAHLLQRPVVHDFRAADLALGGQGAPLVPMADAALLGAASGWRALLNLGGIANLTLIPPDTGPDRQAPVLGWDCGPANTLIDLAVEHFSEGREHVDRDGRRAAAGHIQDSLLNRWLQEPYLHQPPPKSTGRELFGRQDLQRRLMELKGHHPDDCIATLTAFIVVALVFSLYVSFRHQYHFRQRDKNGFVLGSFPSVLPATSTLTDRNNWNEGGCFEARSLDEQDCGISFECSYDMSEVSSRISLRSIRVPSLWLSMPYSQPYYKPFVDEPICEDVKVGNISPMTSEQGSDRGSDIGTPIQIHSFRGGDHYTM